MSFTILAKPFVVSTTANSCLSLTLPLHPCPVLSNYSADSNQRVLSKCGDEFGLPSCHAAAEIDGRVVANALMTVDAHTLGASSWVVAGCRRAARAAQHRHAA